jgi:hypothetical protein
MDRLGGYFGPHDADEPLDDFVDEADALPEPPPSPVGQDERRMQVRAYNHWASLLGDRNFPLIDDLEPHKLDDFGPYSVVLDFANGIEDPEVRFVGAELAAECGEDACLARLSDVPSRSVLSRITDHYMQILANQAPIGFEAEFVNDRGVTVLYRGILLPYSSDNQTIDFICGVINWKEMADQETADELLLEIGQSLGDFDEEDGDSGDASIETPESLTAQEATAMDDDYEDVFDLGNAHMVEPGSDEEFAMPEPAFGQTLHADAPSAKPHRGVDALGNPIGQGPTDDDFAGDEGDESYGDFDSGIKTAADYGLPEWDDDEEEEDVDGVVDPLDGEDSASSLMSLVSRGERFKKSVDLSHAEPPAAMPQAYEPQDHQYAPEPVAYEPEPQAFVPEPPTITFSQPEPFADYGEVEDEDEYGVEDFADAPLPDVAEETVEEEDLEYNEDVFELTAELPPVEEPVAVVSDALAQDPVEEVAGLAVVTDSESPEGLYDCLAAARELAQAAQNTEDRSRKALYQAVSLAYDFSLETEADPEGFAELLEDNGLTVQERAPMTPVVKLVFGAEYDKTRLTEYAAVLSHAHRVGVERGTLVKYLGEVEGGLKGVVQAERRARKEEQGKPVEDSNAVRTSLARKLRKLDSVDFADLASEGPEFALVMVRRTLDGKLVIVGEVPEDIPLVERAARKLLG